MSATNHTTNYELPIFVGSDKPAWLVDWNGAMTAIDTAIHTAEGKADQAGTDIGGIETSISTINSTLTSINNAVSQLRLDTNANTGSINTIQELIGNGTPTTTDKTIIGAINEINSHVYDFDLAHKTATASSSYVTLSSQVLDALLNSDCSVGKVYGNIYGGITALAPANSALFTIAVTDLVVSDAFDVSGYIVQLSQIDGIVTSSRAKLHFNTNGTVDVVLPIAVDPAAYTAAWINLPPCLLFLKDLGD